MNDQTAPQNWPDLAISLYDRLTGRNAEITYVFEDMNIAVPDKVGENPNFAYWKINGTVKIHTRDLG